MKILGNLPVANPGPKQKQKDDAIPFQKYVGLPNQMTKLDRVPKSSVNQT